MGKDDYEVIVCKVLVYFYRKLKGKLSEDVILHAIFITC